MIPPLYEESTATISWETQKAMEHYELDIVFDESFDSACRGKSWSNLLGKDWEWSDQGEVSALSWEEFSNLDAQGLMWRNLNYKEISWADLLTKTEATWRWLESQPIEFTIYSGTGEKIPAPDQGSRWSDFQREQPGNWENTPDKSWLEFALIPSVGQNWHQHKSKKCSWKEMESIAADWSSLEQLPTYGLCWSSLTARWLSWQERTQLGTNGLCWEEIEKLPADNKTHRGIVVDIPLYTKFSMLRVRGFDQSGTVTPYKTTALIKHLPRSLKKYTPPCLHIPTLHEGKKAEIVWGDLYGASSYVLERKLTGNFEKRFDGAGYPVPHPKGCPKPIELHYTPDCKEHLAFVDSIPYYEKHATYRLNGYNTTDSSQWLESLRVPIIPVFYREDTVAFHGVSGKRYCLQLHVKEIEDFEGIIMNLQYDSQALQLEELLSETPAAKSDPNRNEIGNFREISRVLGQLQFQCVREMQKDREWSGLLFSAQFKALRTAHTNLTLS